MKCLVYKCENTSNDIEGVSGIAHWICEQCFEFLTTGKSQKYKFCQIRKNANDLELKEFGERWC